MTVPPEGTLRPRMEKGPAEVLRALASGDPEQLREAMNFQRESFRAMFGCYPEELILHTLCQTCDDYHPRDAVPPGHALDFGLARNANDGAWVNPQAPSPCLAPPSRALPCPAQPCPAQS
jgi:hypothetical protein